MTRTLWPILAGFTLWSIAFIVLYALQYLGCYFAWDPALHRTLLIAAALAAVVLLAFCLLLQLRALRRPGAVPTSIDRIGAGATLAALAATIVTLAPVTFVSMCL
tara:strand:+ start:526 stop:840 length:315 start_codon:yes stop_codon:yes gene_type:complete